MCVACDPFILAGSCVWYDPFKCVTRRCLHAATSHSYVWHDSFTCVTQLIHKCGKAHSYVRCIHMCGSLVCARHWYVRRIHMCGWLICVTYDPFICDATHSCVYGHSCLDCVAVCCNVLQCVVVCCSVLQCGTESCSVLQCVAVRSRVLQCVALCVALCCNPESATHLA